MRRSSFAAVALLCALAGPASAQTSLLRTTQVGDLTSAGSRVWWMQPSANGRFLALQSGPFNEWKDAWLFDRQSRTMRPLDLPSVAEVRLSAAGDRVVFTHWDTDRIWTADVSNLGQARRVSLEESGSPVYSPDGERIAFSAEVPCDPARSDGPTCSTFLVVPARGGQATRIGPSIPFGWALPFAWSPDGQWIYFTFRKQPTDSISWARVPASGGNPQVIFSRLALNPRPHEIGLSPDGRYIALGINYKGGAGRENPSRRIEIWDTQGRQIVKDSLPDGLFVYAWGGDNRLLAVQEETRQVIRTIATSGSGAVTTLTRGLIEETNPLWSPDGRRISFKVGPSASARPAVMNADGSGRRVFTDAPMVMQNSTFPAWAPDGQSLAYRGFTGSQTRPVSPAGPAPEANAELVVVDVGTGRARTFGPIAGGEVVWRGDSRGILHQDPRVTTDESLRPMISERLLDQASARTVLSGLVGYAGIRALYDPSRGMPPAPSWIGVKGNELHLLKPDGSPQVLLSGVKPGLMFPVVSSDLRHFAAHAEGAGNQRWIVGGVGRTPVLVNLPGTPVSFEGPSGRWHPDGSRFFLIAMRPDTDLAGIVSVPAAGGPAVWLPIPEEDDVIAFSLSPDGSRIAYSTAKLVRQTLVEVEVGLPGGR